MKKKHDLKKCEFIKYLFIIISIVAAITLVSLFIGSVNRYGLDFILERDSSLGKWIYFVVCFLQPVMLPLPEPVTIMAGSAAFGSTYGFLIGVIGTIVGILTMFWVARIGGYKLINKFVNPKQLERYRDFVAKNETFILIGLFILPILPDEVVCAGVGVSGVSFKKFMSIAALSKIFTAYAYSQSIELAKIINQTSFQWLLVLAGVVISIYFMIKYAKKNKHSESHAFKLKK